MTLEFCPIYWVDANLLTDEPVALFSGHELNPESAFGDVLRELRHERKLSQEALALNSEVERNYISLLELGKNSASIRTLFRLCASLDVKPSDFLQRVEKRINTSQQASR
ncbi:MAG: helix-turn-helix transcriptional regulator [Polaromonas sp.]